jgi:ketosteroid isomerase-like protein
VGGPHNEHGAPVERRSASILAVRDGRIVRTENYASPDKAHEAAGLKE